MIDPASVMELASIAQLERCHRRHDDVIASLLEAARRLAAGRPDDGDIQRVHDAVAYFQRSVTRHFLDEEGSVFPRLSTRRPELAAELAALSAEHPAQIALQADVAAAARDLDGEARPSVGMALLEAATRLADAHRLHVAREDQIFQGAQDALSPQDDVEIVAEMETRRDRDDGGERRQHGGGGGGGGRGMGGGGGGGRGMGGGGGGGGGGGQGRGMGGGGGMSGGGGDGMGGRRASTRAPTIIASPAAIAKAAAKAKKAKAATLVKATKPATKKSAAKTAKKPAAKKPAAKKPPAKKPPAKKPAAKKSPAKR